MTERTAPEPATEGTAEPRQTIGPDGVTVFSVSPGLEVRTDRERCMGSGNCHFLAPESFDLGDDGAVVVLESVADDEGLLRRAAEGCPVGAISVWKDGRQIGP